MVEMDLGSGCMAYWAFDCVGCGTRVAPRSSDGGGAVARCYSTRGQHPKRRWWHNCLERHTITGGPRRSGTGSECRCVSQRGERKGMSCSIISLGSRKRSQLRKMIMESELKKRCA